MSRYTEDSVTVGATTAGRIAIGGELEVARLGYGAMRLTGQGIWGPPRDRDEALRVLRRAVETIRDRGQQARPVKPVSSVTSNQNHWSGGGKSKTHVKVPLRSLRL